MASLIYDIKQAALFLQQGSLVAFPTETVYGLGANACYFQSCEEIYKLKNRPLNNPLIVHVASLKQALDIGVFSEIALKLAKKFWPGPLSLVLPIHKNAKIASNVIANLDTVAIRIPSHPIALELLKSAGVPVAAPSANISGYITATSSEHVMSDFLDKDLYILADKQGIENGMSYAQQIDSLISHPSVGKNWGLESTIIDTTSPQLKVLRSGAISVEDIKSACEIDIMPYDTNISYISPIAPGMLLAHYSPVSKIRLNAVSIQEDEIGLDFNSKLPSIFSLSFKGDLYEAAFYLYALLRKADKYVIEKGFKGIAVANIPYQGIGKAINDRLTRAAKAFQ